MVLDKILENKTYQYIFIAVIAVIISVICYFLILAEEFETTEVKKDNLGIKVASFEKRKYNEVGDKKEITRFKSVLFNLDKKYKKYLIDENGNIVIDGKIIGKVIKENGQDKIKLNSGDTVDFNENTKFDEEGNIITDGNIVSKVDLEKVKNTQPQKKSKQKEIVTVSGVKKTIPSNFHVDQQGNIYNKKNKKVGHLGEKPKYIQTNGTKKRVNTNKKVSTMNGGKYEFPANYRIDKDGNVYDENGKLVKNIGKVHKLVENNRTKVLNKKDNSSVKNLVPSLNKKKEKKKTPVKKEIITTPKNKEVEVYVSEDELLKSLDEPTLATNEIKKDLNYIKCMIYGNQVVKPYEQIKFMLLEDYNYLLRKHTIFYGIASKAGNRYKIELTRAMYNGGQRKVEGLIYDINYIEGIFAQTLEDEIKEKATDEAIDESKNSLSGYNSYVGSLMGLTSNTVKNVKSNEDLKIELPDGYKLFVTFKEQN